VSAWRNSTGSALSSPDWLEAHHRAKLPERTRFACGIAQHRPQKVVDLGCATGLWLDLLDDFLPSNCELIGIDNDPEALTMAQNRAASWNRPSDFRLFDLANEPEAIPSDADVILAFNVLSYLPHPAVILEHLASTCGEFRLIVRQFDGDTIRLGPLSPHDRFVIDSSLRASLEPSSEFSYYSIDHTYKALMASDLHVRELEFELTERHSPFSAEFRRYFDGSIAWLRGHLSDDACDRLDKMLRGPLYFAEIDLVAVLSNVS
jgi:SAM-dependent methyltransferase